MRLSPSIRPVHLSVIAAILLGGIAASWADQVGNKDALQKAFNEINQRRERWFNGEDAALKSDANAVKAIANYYIHRISHTPENKDFIQAVHKEFNSAISRIEKPAKNNRAFVDLFAPALVASLQEVFANNNVKTDGSVVVNAAMMLPTMARLQHPAINDYLTKLVQDEKGTHDAVRLYALKALRETMPIRLQLEPDATLPQFEDFNDAKQNARRLFDAKNVDALTKYIEGADRPQKVDSMTPEQIETLRYLRREAIASLSQAGAPAVVALKKPEKVFGLVAPTLLKVLAGDLQPPPTLSEKVEAALGLCAMRYPKMPEYNPDLANYLIGRTLLDFTAKYNEDLINFSVVGAKRQVPYLPWKGDAARLKAGLKQLVDNAQGASARAGAEGLELRSGAILNSISMYKNTEIARVQELNLYVTKIAPKDGKPFKNLKVPEIQLK